MFKELKSAGVSKLWNSSNITTALNALSINDDVINIQKHYVFWPFLWRLKAQTWINFLQVLQIFFPYSQQIYSDKFPGEDPNDCPRDIKKEVYVMLNWSSFMISFCM